MNSTTKYPATVRELGDMAASQGMKASELLEMLGPIPIPIPPAGYVLAEGCDDRWIGAQVDVGEMTIVPVWNAVDQHLIELWTAKGTEDASMVDLSPAAAFDLAAELIAAAESARVRA